MFLLVAAFRLDRGLRSHDPFPESNVICGLVFALPTLAIAGLNYLGQRRRVTYRGRVSARACCDGPLIAQSKSNRLAIGNTS